MDEWDVTTAANCLLDVWKTTTARSMSDILHSYRGSEDAAQEHHSCATAVRSQGQEQRQQQ